MPIFRRCGDGFVEKLADDRVAVCRHSNGLTSLCQRADHARAGVGLACARRPLDGKDAFVEMKRDAERSVLRSFARLLECLPAKTRRDGH